MVKSKEEIIEKLKSVKKKLKEDYLVESIGLFGSYVSDNQTSISDIGATQDRPFSLRGGAEYSIPRKMPMIHNGSNKSFC